MLRRFEPALACVVLLAASAAVAQAQPASTPVAPVTALGGVDQQAFEFVKAYAQTTPNIEQIPRWRDPICAQVIGLPADQAAQVKARIEDVAKAVGVAAAPAGCAANIEIAFAAQPQRI